MYILTYIYMLMYEMRTNKYIYIVLKEMYEGLKSYVQYNQNSENIKCDKLIKIRQFVESNFKRNMNALLIYQLFVFYVLAGF